VNQATLAASLKLHEGVRSLPYEDSVGILTIGVGHNLEKPISKAAIEQILQDDIAEAISEMDRMFAGWKNHNDTRQNVLVEMCFNLGGPRLKGFANMWQALQFKEYHKAATEMLNSRWAKQVGKRAQTLAEAMRNG